MKYLCYYIWMWSSLIYILGGNSTLSHSRNRTEVYEMDYKLKQRVERSSRKGSILIPYGLKPFGEIVTLHSRPNKLAIQLLHGDGLTDTYEAEGLSYESSRRDTSVVPQRDQVGMDSSKYGRVDAADRLSDLSDCLLTA